VALAAAVMSKLSSLDDTEAEHIVEVVGVLLKQIQRMTEVLELKLSAAIDRILQGFESRLLANGNLRELEARHLISDDVAATAFAAATEAAASRASDVLEARMAAAVESAADTFYTKVDSTMANNAAMLESMTATLEESLVRAADISEWGGAVGGEAKPLDAEPEVVELAGFMNEQLNAKFFRCRLTTLNGHATFWTVNEDAFIYKCPYQERWIASTTATDKMAQILAGFSLGAAIKEDMDFSNPDGWMESSDAGTFRSTGRLVHGSKLDRFLSAC